MDTGFGTLKFCMQDVSTRAVNFNLMSTMIKFTDSISNQTKLKFISIYIYVTKL